MTDALCICALELNEKQRVTLVEWKAELTKLAEQQRTCRARKVHGALGMHLSSAIRCASGAVAELCAPAEGELLAAAARTIAPWFTHAGDARAMAAQFPAFAALRGFLRGPKSEDTLSRLADQAEAVSDLIGRILDGKEIWKWEGMIG